MTEGPTLMKTVFLKEEDLAAFAQGLMGRGPVIAPVAKRSRFDFVKLEDAADLRLDYDTTILPPKKAFFPTQQDLVCFGADGFHSCIDPQEQVLFGVHPHDIKGIVLSDIFYAENKADNAYLANRAATTIVGCSVQNHYKHAFFGSVCLEVAVSGHDMFLTKVDGGYVVDVLTDKGEALLASGTFSDASDEQAGAAKAANEAAMAGCPEKLNGDSATIKQKVRGAFENDEFWNACADDCFSCGSCNTVCPTCYCFDVQDERNLAGASGKRYRCWDACLTSEFSEVSVQGGSENFREERGARFRHRFMRKTAYLNDTLGGPACIGCGRCSGACTADIANPTEVINKILEQ